MKDAKPKLLDLEEVIEQPDMAEIELKQSDTYIKKLIQKAQLDSELQNIQEYQEKINFWHFRAYRKVIELNKRETHDGTFSKQ